MSAYSEADVELVRNAPVFDADWYLKTYPDVAVLEMDPAEHYLWVGADLGRNPSPSFDAVDYLAKRPRVAASGVNPVIHWVRTHGGAQAEELGTRARTHIGPAFDAEVAKARRKERPAGLNAEYDEIRAHFDVQQYILQTPQLLDQHPDLDPIRFFAAHGSKRPWHSPDINFSLRKYLEVHPELKGTSARQVYLHWLREGKPAGDIADPAPGIERMAPILGMSQGEVVDRLSAKRLDLQERLRYGKLGEMFAKAAEVEPLVHAAWTEATRPKLLPFGTPQVVDMISAIYSAQRVAGFRRARLLLVINRPRWGGGRRIEGHLAHALAAKALEPDDIVVIYTDHRGQTPRGRYPGGVREIDLAGIAEANGLDREHSERVLVEVIRSFRAEAVVNINSQMFYRALGPYGKALRATERLFLCMFCNEQEVIGSWIGHPLKNFYRYFDLVDGVLTDSHYLRDWFVDMYQLGGEDLDRLHVFSAPVEPNLPVATPPPSEPSRRPQVFWAGRWDRQKRIDLVLEVATEMPDVDFRMWGEAVKKGAGSAEVLPANVTQEGRYGHLSEIPLDEADVWLYTSGWDGVPSQLLEVAMTEVPMVGTLVGGTGEVLLDGLSRRVDAEAGAGEYVAAIREVLADPDTARKRSRQLRARLIGERTEQAYAAQAAKVLLRTEEDEA